MLISVAVVLLIIGLAWLAIGFVLICALFILFTSKLNFTKYLGNQKVLSYVMIFAGVLVLAVSMRVFIFEIYSIPTGSMKNTLIPGDKVLVCKLNYGPKLPRSPFEIPWFNVFFYLNKKSRAKSDSTWWHYRRLNGYSKINRGDIVVFQPPFVGDDVFIKRCVALPGDTIQVIRSQVYINGKKQEDPLYSRFSYMIWYNNLNSFRSLADSLGIQKFGLWVRKQNGFVELNLTKGQKNQLEKTSVVDSVVVKTIKTDLNNNYTGMLESFSTTDSYGPIMIPGKEYKIILNGKNSNIYTETFNKFEKFAPEMGNGHSIIENTGITNFTVNQNYYFMMGDNRYHSNDSRAWGFVPEQNIVGKAVLILFSKNRKEIKWNRFLKRL